MADIKGFVACVLDVCADTSKEARHVGCCYRKEKDRSRGTRGNIVKLLCCWLVMWEDGAMAVVVMMMRGGGVELARWRRAE